MGRRGKQANRHATGAARPSLRGRLAESEPVAYAASVVPTSLPERFVILCTPRSGSELLVDLLDQVPGISCTGEVFHQRDVRRPQRYLDGRARIAGARGADAWGCKVLAQHLLPEEDRFGPAEPLLRSLVDDGWKLVHLRRENVLAAALSYMQAGQTGRWHDRGAAPTGFEPIEADIADVFAWIHGCDAHQRWLDDLVAGFPHVPISYEDDLQDAEGQQRSVDAIARAVGVPPAPVEARVRRGAPSDPWARLADPEPLKELLRLTRFAHLVDR